MTFKSYGIRKYGNQTEIEKNRFLSTRVSGLKGKQYEERLEELDTTTLEQRRHWPDSHQRI
jgi:hypothetical protein